MMIDLWHVVFFDLVSANLLAHPVLHQLCVTKKDAACRVRPRASSGGRSAFECAGREVGPPRVSLGFRDVFYATMIDPQSARAFEPRTEYDHPRTSRQHEIGGFVYVSKNVDVARIAKRLRVA